MQQTEYMLARKFIEENATALMSHEKKPFAKSGFPPQNYSIHRADNRIFYAVGTNIFRGIIYDNILLEAMRLFPSNFGNGNAVSVIHAVSKTAPIPFHSRMKDIIRVLQNENGCYIVENNNGTIPNKILRLDLFRKLDPIRYKRRKYDFTGGLFHALKHFSYQGLPLSTNREKNDIDHPSQIIDLAIRAFFCEQGQFVDKLTYVTILNINSNHALKFAFYCEPNTKVFFIKTVHIAKEKRK